MASYHLPKVVKAEDLTVREGKLTWSSHGVSSEIDVGSLLFALKPPASAHQYIICGLKENNSESAATTFELVLLQTNSIPDQISSLHLVSQIPPHLRPSTDNLVDIVVSTKAGSGLALRFWQTVLHPLLRVAREELAQASPGTEAAELAGIQQESVLVTENAGSVPQFAQRLWASHGGQAHRDGGGKQSRTVILLSGDGGVVDILNSCEEDHDAQAPAAIVHESDTPAYRAHGQKRFGMVAQELLRRSHPYTAQVEIRRPGAAAASFERGERIMDVMMKAYDGGKHVGLAWEEDGERVWYDEVEEIRLKALDADGRWRKVCIDGTIVELPVGGDVVVSKSNHTLLRVLAPKEVLPA
ncbi:unnamed protein product [Clonostachys rosea f. rosea IK726]|uniref:DAGKc domain-containing protein n=2 Tax=Bionectria ochroleuca TaxID=29856 RepID=A0A0B7JHJ8_BIOOC|nr:unnamed protein product [Clonostachys rosea f. rosea IK726]